MYPNGAPFGVPQLAVKNDQNAPTTGDLHG
jgi:hypothetical protein